MNWVFSIEERVKHLCVWRVKCLPYSRCLAYVYSSRIGVCLLHRTPPCVIIFEWLCLVVGLGFWSSYNLVLDAIRHPWSYWCCFLVSITNLSIFFHFQHWGQCCVLSVGVLGKCQFSYFIFLYSSKKNREKKINDWSLWTPIGLWEYEYYVWELSEIDEYINWMNECACKF